MFGSPSGQDFSRIFVGNYNSLKFREAINALIIPLVFRDTRDHQEHDAKNRLLIPTFRETRGRNSRVKKNRP